MRYSLIVLNRLELNLSTMMKMNPTPFFELENVEVGEKYTQITLEL